MLAAVQLAKPLYSAAPVPPFSALKLSFRSTVWAAAGAAAQARVTARREARRTNMGSPDEGSWGDESSQQCRCRLASLHRTKEPWLFARSPAAATSEP